MVIFGGTLIVLLLLAGIVWILFLYDRLSYSRVHGWNDPTLVERFFAYILKVVRRELIIHDDGDDSVGSIYNSDRVVEALRARLKQTVGFRVRVLFNFRQELEVNKLATEFPGRVEIRYRNGERAEGDIHYKIVDGGKAGYLSRHSVGDEKREYEFFNCSLSRKRVRERIFGDYCQRFEQEFEAAEA